MNRQGPAADERLLEVFPPPPHGFVGRGDELREAERVIDSQHHLALRGEHGEGKTALAAALVRRLLAAGRVERAAYVSLEVHHDARAVRYSIGQQLVPSFSLATSQDPRLAVQLLERVLREHPTLVVLDDLEAVLPRGGQRGRQRGEAPPSGLFEPSVLDELLLLVQELCDVGPTRVVLVSREPLPAPYGEGEIVLAGLPAGDAVELLRGALAGASCEPHEPAALAARVDGHAASLVSLAGTVAAAGAERTAATLAEGAAAIASLALSGRRHAAVLGVEVALGAVPADLRRKLPPLAVFVGGGHLTAIAAVLELDVENDEEVDLAERLIGAGLVEMLPHNYLRFHPGLAPALAAELDEDRLAAARAAWAEATAQLVDFLGQEQIRSPRLAATLTLLDLGNLLACLEHLAAGADADQAVELADAVATLVLPLGRPAAMARVDALRESACERLRAWSHDQYLLESAALEVLMDVGRPDDTVAAARRLLHRAATVGDDAYEGAAFDHATLHLTVGLAELMADQAEAAVKTLAEAGRRFRELAAAGHPEAPRMETQALARTGDAWRALARPDAAEAAYRRAVDQAEDAGDRAQAAEVRTQLGALYFAQGRTDEALAELDAARRTLAALDEPRAVAGIWHQIASVHQTAGRMADAERALRRAIAQELGLGDRAAAAGTLTRIGELHAACGFHERALEAYRGAAEHFAELGDLAKEGIARSQMADKLIRLGRYDEARRELERTIECDAPFGHEAEPWRTFSLLSRLEGMAGDRKAMIAARERAVDAYLRYRRDGGASQVGHGPIFEEVSRAVLDGEAAEVTAKIDSMLRRRDLPAPLRALIPALEAVLAGSRDPALAADPGLYYRDAAELLLLFETLEGASSRVSDVVF